MKLIYPSVITNETVISEQEGIFNSNEDLYGDDNIIDGEEEKDGCKSKKKKKKNK